MTLPAPERMALCVDNIAAPADHATREALTVIKTNQPVSDELLDKIAKEIDAISAFSLNL